MQVTLRFPDYNPINWIAVLYGFVPFPIHVSFLVMAVLSHKFVWFYGTALTAFVFILTEFLLKPYFNEPRPMETANKYPDGRIKPGMPSGHCTNGFCLATWILLEVVFQETIPWNFFWAVVAAMGPVPWARWHNRDHTGKQCILSTIFGILLGTFAYFVRVSYFDAHHWYPWEMAKAGKIAAQSAAVPSGEAVSAPSGHSPTMTA